MAIEMVMVKAEVRRIGPRRSFIPLLSSIFVFGPTVTILHILALKIRAICLIFRQNTALVGEVVTHGSNCAIEEPKSLKSMKPIHNRE
jgi:acetyltransferase-like isoleucine patch superfamily enzyme